MIQLPMIGTEEQTESSTFQITLVDQRDTRLHPMDYPRTNRYFDNVTDRNTFIQLFESTVQKHGGKLVHNARMSHPVFEVFDIYDEQGNTSFEITMYR